MASLIGEFRKSITDAIAGIDCRPKDANFPNQPLDEIKEDLPRMDVQFLSLTNTALFAGNEVIKTQIVQVDFWVDKGKNLSEMDGYVDSLQRTFTNHRMFGDAKCVSPPEIGLQGYEGNSYRISLTIAFELFIDNSIPIERNSQND